MSIASAILGELTDAELADLAAPLAPYMPAAPAAADGWLNATEAARYLSCPRSRIHDLVQLRKLEPRRDGRRLLFRRSDFDSYLEERR